MLYCTSKLERNSVDSYGCGRAMITDMYSCANEGERMQFIIYEYIIWSKERAFYYFLFFSSYVVFAIFFSFVSVYYDSVASRLRQYVRAHGRCCTQYCVCRWQPRRSLSIHQRPKVSSYCYWIFKFIFKSERTENWIFDFVLVWFLHFSYTYKYYILILIVLQ